jgi:hypothetical protein
MHALAIAVALVAVVCLLSPASAAPPPIQPMAAMTVTVVLNKAAYLSGDTATATAVVYRTPAPGNYTYTWTVRDGFFRVVNTTTTAGATFTYLIPLAYTGLQYFEATVNDGQGLIITSRSSAIVSRAVMSLRLDRGDFSPGDTIAASYSVSSHVILQPTYDYEVDDITGTIVYSGNTNGTFFSYTTRNPASRTYVFRVTARQGANSTTTQVSISQTSGVILGVIFDKAAYGPGETIRAHLGVVPRGSTSLPIQFTWVLAFGPGFGGSSVSAITTVPEVDLSLPVPSNLGSGDILMIAQESSTGTFTYRTVHIGAAGASTFWITDVGGVPLYAVLLGLFVVLLLVAVLGLWRRTGGGLRMFRRRGTPPPPSGENVP